MDKLTNWFGHIDHVFKLLREHCLDYRDKQKRRVFIDRGSSVLFVAHLDTAQAPRYYRQNKSCVYASGLDDRLGCWLAWTLSEELGADLLLTDLEERGATTAQYHACKQYNWIAEFDRAGADVVTYGLDNAQFIAAIKEFFTLGQGIFSDVCWLKTEACCVNVGIGYELAHSRNSFADLFVMQRQIDRFKRFYAKYKDTAFVRDYSVSVPDFDLDYGIPDSYLMSEDDNWLDDNTLAVTNRFCEICGGLGHKVFGHTICEQCFENIVWQHINYYKQI